MLIQIALLLSLTWAKKACASVRRKPQNHPPTYVHNSVKANRKVFEAHERKQLTNNAQIPPLCSEAIRIATFNVHYFKDLHEKHSNLEFILTDIKNMQATVLILEEVVRKGDARRQFDAAMKKQGYVHQAAGYGKGAWLGNVIYSKLPLKKIKVTQLGSKRCLVQAQLGSLTLYGTHLEVKGGETRTKQAKKIIKVIGKQGRSLLAGDMNDHHDSAPIKLFRSKLTEAFSALEWPQPTYTCWAGTTIDFVFLSKALKGDLLGAYLYHTHSSDHLPVIVDLKLGKEGSETSSSSSTWSSWSWSASNSK